MTHPDPGNQAFLLAADKAYQQCEENDEAIELKVECEIYLRFEGHKIFADPITVRAEIEAWEGGYYRALTATTDTGYVIDLLGEPSKLDPVKNYIKNHINVIEKKRIKGLIEAKFADLALNA